LSSDPHRFEPVVKVWAVVDGASGDHTCVGTSFGDALLAQGPLAVGTLGEIKLTTLALLRYEKGHAVRRTIRKRRGLGDHEKNGDDRDRPMCGCSDPPPELLRPSRASSAATNGGAPMREPWRKRFAGNCTMLTANSGYVRRFVLR
jgi:hypothetical protein